MAKSKYNPDTFPLLAEEYARNRMTDEDIAAKLGISTTSFYEYQKKYPEFSEAVTRGKKPVDVEVKNALLKRALGYEVTETKSELVKGEMQVVQETVKHIQPDVKAIDLWLSNRDKDWNSGNDLNLKGKIAISFEGREEPTVDGQG